MAFLRSVECRQLCRRRFPLMLRLPLRKRFAVDVLAGLVPGHVDAVLRRGLAIPVGKAVAAEPREDHQVEVLHVAALVEMLQQAAECGGFEFGGSVGHNVRSCKRAASGWPSFQHGFPESKLHGCKKEHPSPFYLAYPGTAFRQPLPERRAFTRGVAR